MWDTKKRKYQHEERTYSRMMCLQMDKDNRNKRRRTNRKEKRQVRPRTESKSGPTASSQTARWTLEPNSVSAPIPSDRGRGKASGTTVDAGSERATDHDDLESSSTRDQQVHDDGLLASNQSLAPLSPVSILEPVRTLPGLDNGVARSEVKDKRDNAASLGSKQPSTQPRASISRNKASSARTSEEPGSPSGSAQIPSDQRSRGPGVSSGELARTKQPALYAQHENLGSTSGSAQIPSDQSSRGPDGSSINLTSLRADAPLREDQMPANIANGVGSGEVDRGKALAEGLRACYQYDENRYILLEDGKVMEGNLQHDSEDDFLSQFRAYREVHTIDGYKNQGLAQPQKDSRRKNGRHIRTEYLNQMATQAYIIGLAKCETEHQHLFAVCQSAREAVCRILLEMWRTLAGTQGKLTLEETEEVFNSALEVQATLKTGVPKFVVDLLVARKEALRRVAQDKPTVILNKLMEKAVTRHSGRSLRRDLRIAGGTTDEVAPTVAPLPIAEAEGSEKSAQLTQADVAEILGGSVTPERILQYAHGTEHYIDSAYNRTKQEWMAGMDRMFQEAPQTRPNIGHRKVVDMKEAVAATPGPAWATKEELKAVPLHRECEFFPTNNLVLDKSARKTSPATGRNGGFDAAVDVGALGLSASSGESARYGVRGEGTRRGYYCIFLIVSL